MQIQIELELYHLLSNSKMCLCNGEEMWNGFNVGSSSQKYISHFVGVALMISVENGRQK